MLLHILFLLALQAAATPVSFTVEHDHLLRSCKGELFFKEDAVIFKSQDKDHNRTWAYQDIQQVELHPGRISVLTYEDRKIEFGKDRVFTFDLIDGNVSETLVGFLDERLARPVISSVIPSGTQILYSVPARHRRFLDDSEGVLEIGEQYVIYRTSARNGSRVWRYDEILSMGSTGPFQLRLGAVEKTGAEYGEERNYVFDLKRRLLPEEYDFIWNRINRPFIDQLNTRR